MAGSTASITPTPTPPAAPWSRPWARPGLLDPCVPAAFGGARDDLDSRLLCIARERLAYADGLADFAFAMQGLGTGAIRLAGTPALQQRVLPAVARGR